MLFQCWPAVYDVGPTLNQHWFNVSCLLGLQNIDIAKLYCSFNHQVARGALPHYCNFVKRLRLHARSRDSMSPKPDHSHSSSRSSSRQRTARGEGQGDRAELESRCGIEGRPGSPSELRDDDRGLDGGKKYFMTNTRRLPNAG